MTARGMWGVQWSLVCRALACGLGLGIAGLGCANRSATATVLTAAGAAAVIVGASMAADNQCYESPDGVGPPYCSPGLSKSTRNAGTALAIAGVGAAAAGYALQPKGPDQLAPAPAPRAPTGPYRLLRRAPPAPEPSSGTAASEAAATPEAATPEAATPEAGTPESAPPETAPPATPRVE